MASAVVSLRKQHVRMIQAVKGRSCEGDLSNEDTKLYKDRYDITNGFADFRTETASRCGHRVLQKCWIYVADDSTLLRRTTRRIMRLPTRTTLANGHISSRKKPTHRKWTCGPEGPSSNCDSIAPGLIRCYPLARFTDPYPDRD